MTTRHLVRKIVRATHRWPLLGSAYRGVYRIAAYQAAQLAVRHGNIAAIYARNSYALGLWEPGRSDIDLTVVWRDPRREDADTFHRDYHSLRKHFPMLGEVEMIDEGHLEAWTRHGFTGLQSRQWLKLAGEHTFECRYAGHEPLDRLRHAVSLYRWQFLPHYWLCPRPDGVLQRIAAKIMRLLGCSVDLNYSPSEIFRICLSELSAAIRTLDLDAQGRLVDGQILLNPKPKPPFLAKTFMPPRGIDAVIGLERDLKPRHILVHAGFEPHVVETNFWGAAVMDAQIFRFYLCYVDPLEYFTLLQERAILAGEDPLAQEIAFSKRVLRESVCHYSADMLTFPFGEDLGQIPDQKFYDLLYGWFLRTLHYFEEGAMEFDYYALRVRFGDRHAETVDRFALLSGIAGEICNHLAQEFGDGVPK